MNCFVKKNTPELKKNLSNLGYIYGGSTNIKINQPYIYCSGGKYFECSQKPARDCVIDCEDNEELFLAILSLNNNSDINQWFVSETGIFVICGGNTFDPYKEGLSLEDCKLQWHKASIDELIKYFKK